MILKNDPELETNQMTSGIHIIWMHILTMWVKMWYVFMKPK